MSLRRNAPDSQALAIAREMQEKLQPAGVILLGSRAAGDHRPDSDVDLMAVVPDDNGKRAADGILRGLLEGKYEVPVANVSTITMEEFQRTAPMAQSQAGQAARHGVTPEGSSLDYVAEREPETEEIRQATIFWLTLAERHLRSFVPLSESERFTGFQIPAFEGQQALERAFKSILTSDNDPARFRRDAAVMWRHTERTRPVADRNGARAMEELLKGTAGPDGQRCRLTEFSEAFRRGDFMPELTEPEQEAVRRYLAPAVNMLIVEALARSGGTREDIQEERHRVSGLHFAHVSPRPDCSRLSAETVQPRRQSGHATKLATGLTTGTMRHYRVSAITSHGTSSASNTANATTATLTPSPATGVPAITVPNALRVKAVLTANKGTIADTNGLPEESVFTWQWVRVDGSTDTDIAGATSQTYTLTYADVGKTIKVKASFTDNAGDSEGPLTSAATSPILGQDACYAPTYRGGATQIWTGKVGVEPSPAGDLGYSGPLSEAQHGSLDTPSFTVTTGGSSFTVVTIRTDTTGRLIFGVNSKYGVAERQLSLYVCDQQILFSEATKLIHPTYDLRSWSPQYGDFNWSNQAERTIHISRDQTPPTFAEVNFSGTAITVTFTEDLNAASLPDGAFTVKKTPTSGTEETVTLSGTPTINGKTVTLTLGAAPAATDKVTLTYTKPASGTGNKLADKFGNEAANFTNVLLRSRHEPSGQDFRHSAGTPGFVTTGTASRGQLTYPADEDPWADYGDPSWGDMFRLVGLEPRKTYRVEVAFNRVANTVGGSIQMYICCNHGPDPYAVSEWDSNYDGRAIFDFDTGRSVGATFVSVIPSNSMNPDVWEFGSYTVKLTDVTGLRKLVSNTRQRPATVTYAKVGKNTDLHATDRTQWATSFVTGSNPDGYTLDRITAYISLTDGTDTGTGTPKVTILNNATSDRPGTDLCDLQSLADYDTGLNLSNGDWPDELYSTGCASNTLEAGTTYWVVFHEDSRPAQTYFVGEADKAIQDPGSASGWSIGDHYYRKTGARGWIKTDLSPLAIGVYGTPKK